MKKIFFFILFFVVSITLPSWGQSSTGKIPTLVPMTKDAKVPYMEILTSCVTDTTKIRVNVVYVFDKKFSDTVKLNSLKEMRIRYFTYSNQNINKGDVPSRDNCILRVCEAQFKIWTKNQPYNKMYDIERFYGHDRITFGYNLYLIPKKTTKR